MKINENLKRKARAEGIPLWKVAAEVGVSEPTLTRWLRVPLEGEHRERVTAALQALIERERGEGSHD